MPIIEIIFTIFELFFCFKIKKANKKAKNTEIKNVKISNTRIDFCEIAVYEQNIEGIRIIGVKRHINIAKL